MAHPSSLFTFFLLSFLSFFVAAQDGVNPGDVNPVPPTGEIKTEDPISSPLTDGCPQPCAIAGNDPANWTQLHSLEELSGCELPMLFTFNVANSYAEDATLSTCVTSTSTQTRREEGSRVEARAAQSSVTIANNCGADKGTVKASSSFGRTGVLRSGNSVAAAAGLLADYLDNGATCGITILFAKHGSSIASVYVGPEVQKSSAASTLRQSQARLQKGVQAFQVCGTSDKQAQTLGFFAADAVSGLETVQAASRTWLSGKCVNIAQASKESINLGIFTTNALKARSVELQSRFAGVDNVLASRATCRSIQVKSGDLCPSLAKRCGTTLANFKKYNNKKANFCNTLAVKQDVCCNAGTLPDRSPKPYKDGACYSYKIKTGDTCYSLSQAFFITTKFISDVNKNTWGWAGCDKIVLGQTLCLSKGKAPLPMTVAGAVCGPQVPGTKKPSSFTSGWDFAKLNPCPLNACCSSYGFCGVTSDFCTNSTAKGAAPGTSTKQPGCIGNCGTKIVGNTKKPAKFLNVGYFQGYNLGRPCLNMDVTNLTAVTTKYTHIHFAFAGLKSDMSVLLQPDVREQFLKFKEVKGSWKKIISFGGWAGSTDAATYQLFRDAIKSANRNKFAYNVMTVLKNHNLDGVDFDWEYPGTSTDSTEDAANYVAFLKVMRNQIGKSGKTMSVALPASFWYLKPFAVKEMAPLVDYIVYMTYDLHGQWDYGNNEINSGCPGGNCLRSHVNKTETLNSLAMITKAGVDPAKIVVGLSSYGRSFKMSNPSCTGPTCKFSGSFSVSNAEPGFCTGEAGYLSDAEIRLIEYDARQGKKGVTAKTWYDSSSDSDIMTFGTQGKGMTDWVAYMSPSTKQKRTQWVQGLNFGGVVDWAIDLENWFSPKPTDYNAA